MEYTEFSSVFNSVIFENSKANLIRKIAENPKRYVGLFRPTNPKAKIIQNITQSNEIRFGDAFEQIIEKYFLENEYAGLERRINYPNGESLVMDQLLQRLNKVIFIEHKVRDDHDSTKKRGQIENFKKKLSELVRLHKESELRGYFYFIDSSLSKNKNYYQEELDKLSVSSGVTLKLVYGKELFEDLGLGNVWEEIEKHLLRWRKELPELPNINFDADAEDTFEEIKVLGKSVYKKLFEAEEVIKDIFPIIFPEKKTLRLLKNHFEKQKGTIYSNLVDKLDMYLQDGVMQRNT